MMTDDHLVATLIASRQAYEAAHRAMLQSVVETALSAHEAKACSVLRLDEAAGEFVFEAVAGAGEGELNGRRFRADRGVAGWSLAARQPVTVADSATEAAFARDIAESTGYVPRAIMAAPLLREDAPLGVLEVLDSASGRTATDALALATVFAAQAAIALDLLRRDLATANVVSSVGQDMRDLMELSGLIGSMRPGQRAAVLRLLADVRDLDGERVSRG
jgi:GAF domain-containing protein